MTTNGSPPPPQYITGLRHEQHSGQYVADTTEYPFRVEITADKAREIIGRAFSEDTIASIMQWGDDEVITLELSELMELEQALDEIAERADYEESIAAWYGQG